MDINLSKLWETVKDREAWRGAACGVAKGQTWLSDWTTQQHASPGSSVSSGSPDWAGWDKQGLQAELCKRTAVPGHRSGACEIRIELLCASLAPSRNPELFSNRHMCARGGSDADVQDMHCCICALLAGAPTSLGTSDHTWIHGHGQRVPREGTAGGELLGWLDHGTSYGQGMNKYWWAQDE